MSNYFYTLHKNNYTLCLSLLLLIATLSARVEEHRVKEYEDIIPRGRSEYPNQNISTERTKIFHDLFNHANDLLKENNYNEAITLYQHAINLDPSCAQAHFNLGVALQAKGSNNEAMKSFEEAIKYNPNYIKAHLQLAKLFYEYKKLEPAINHFNRVLQSEPDNIEGHLGLARIYCEKQNFTRAVTHLTIIQKQDIDNIHILFDLANTLNMANQTADALDLYKQLLEKTPNNPSIIYNIAYTLKKVGKVEEAMPYYHRVLELNPNHNEAHFSLGLAYLMTGEWEKGWEEYEWRWNRSSQETGKRTYKQPQWDGSSLQGKTIYLYAEQGLGDTFQFIRYAQIAKEKGGSVIVSVQSPLTKILSLCPYIDKVISLQEQPRTFDCYAPLMSLPHILKTRIDNAPANIPYLYADPELEHYWKEKLAHDHNFKVGICWQGNSNYSTPFLRAVVAAKSIPLAKFRPLMNIPGVSFYSLQKETGMEQLQDMPKDFNLHTFGNDFDTTNGRFMDTAAIVKNLDLVISIDTSICHFAAGLGTPTWNMVPNPPDWRWMFDCTDTPWYPNMRLFRQPVPDDWDSVLNVVAQELYNLVHKDHQNITITNRTRTKQPITTPVQYKTEEGTTEPLFMKQQLEQELSKIDRKLLALTKSIKNNTSTNPNDIAFVELVRSFYWLNEMRSNIKTQLAALN